MFSFSQFNGDISEWNVNKLKLIRNAFIDFKGDVPCWNIEDEELRKKIIKSKELEDKLEEKTKKINI